MGSFKRSIAGTILAATASIGALSPLEAKATPSPGEDGAYVTHVEPCVPRVTVSDNVVDNTIRIRINVPISDNTCQISSEIYLFIQDDGRPQPLRLPGILTGQNLWVVRPDGVRSGRYRVMGLNPTPNGIGDYDYIPSRELGIDQVITVGGTRLPPTQQIHPVSPPPPVEAAPTRQVVTTLDPDSKQLLRNFDQWMRWFQVNIWPQLQPLIRAIEGIKTS
jgi:hypothetical protein